MMFERFSQGASPLHRRDIRIKVISAAILVPAIALSKAPLSASAGLIIGLALVLVARLNLRELAVRLLLVNSFVAFLWLTLPLSYPGTSLYSIGPVSISAAGVALAFLITIKANAIFLLLMTLLATATVADLGYGLERLRLPSKLCMLLLFAYRYIFVIHQEYQRLARSAKLRCFEPKTNLHSYRTFAHLFGMTLLKSWHRAERVRQAMLLRGFQGQFHSINQFAINRGDICFLGVMVALAMMLATGNLLFAG